ncbi:MAG: hypothetical protein U0103_09200 [Candidatus Obscuribacterales bacterium]|nr:MAG: glycoside hydrolase family 15 [Candidatus Melainabacteria bacterium]
MRKGFQLVASVCAALVFGSSTMSAQPALATIAPDSTNKPVHQLSPMVIGNGFGFAVVNPSCEVTRFYAHPYRFERPNEDVSKDGDSTANYFKKAVWSNSGATKSPVLEYVGQSHVLASHNGSETNYFFNPFGVKHNVFVLLNQSIPATTKHAVPTTTKGSVPTTENGSASATGNGSVKPSVEPFLSVEWSAPIEKEETLTISGRSTRILQLKGIKEPIAVLSTALDGRELVSSTKLVGAGWAFISADDRKSLETAVQDFIRWQQGDVGKSLVDREVKSLDDWRLPPRVKFANDKERLLWRQSETFLRMAQIQEPDIDGRHSKGLILASLPDGVWFTPWVRDMAYALVALTRMGHTAEAREAILGYFNARPVGRWKNETKGLDYQISVTRYYGDGSEEADYSGLQTPNVEFDDWGLALWTVAEYWQKTHDLSLLTAKTYRGPLYESMRDYVVMPLLGNLDPVGNGGLIVAADSSCWEEHQQNKRHHAFDSITAINGLRGFLEIAKAKHDDKTVQLVSDKIKALEIGFKSAFVKDNSIRGTVETSFKNEIDGSVLEAFNMGVISDPAVMKGTIDKLELLKTASGGYRRVRGSTNYEKHEFLFINFLLARVLNAQAEKLTAPAAERARAAAILSDMVESAVIDHGLIPEMYVSEKSSDYPGEIGAPAGSIPMVGYGAGIYAITLLERENASAK